ncbi:helix-turn-helix transcriptional regulator [Euzebya tangerina]|uniref:helix-turn-helix transcriptional regulator n=1 Tax=Euzebya tangerina TaxID=591198 RepID=UPI000E31FB4F|nr:winged helix-turn-helix domain-containing protein [Euzebya tangerina]
MATSWSLLSNHGHVLVAVAQDPDARLRDIADAVGVTERAVHAILTDLIDAGYVSKQRDGRRNHYEVHLDLTLRHPLERGHRIGDLLNAVSG